MTFCGGLGCCGENVLKKKESDKVTVPGGIVQMQLSFWVDGTESDCEGQGKSRKSSQNQLETGSEAQATRKLE